MIIHSITNTEDKIIVADMPMKFSLFNLLNFEQPLYFDKKVLPGLEYLILTK